MIKSIVIKDIATFNESEHPMKNLKKLNFIFGLNGSGKTTISRVLKQPDKYSGCEVEESTNNLIQREVYNSDFVEKNFMADQEIKGIFTLGEDEGNTKKEIRSVLGKIRDMENKKNEIEVEIKKVETRLEILEKNSIEEIWKKTEIDRNGILKNALKGRLNSKKQFFEKILNESKNAIIQTETRDRLEERARVIFNKNLARQELLQGVNTTSIQELSESHILVRKLVGKEDIGFSDLINKLNNSDWVKSGTVFLENSQGYCPFCQQMLPHKFGEEIGAYFDERYDSGLRDIENLKEDYERETKKILDYINNILRYNSENVDNEALRKLERNLDVVFSSNIVRLKEKLENPTIVSELKDCQEFFEEICNLIVAANNKIEEHNKIVDNLNDEREKIRRSSWCFVANECAHEIEAYKKAYKQIQNEKADLEEKIKRYEKELEINNINLENLQNKLTSIIPTKNKINKWLEEFGFTGFRLAVGDDECSYKIVRDNRTDARSTLSEGERNFITFLYFYELLQGANENSGKILDKIVVIDDPVSSLDNNVLFIVSTLISRLYADISDNKGSIKQLFLFTHNLYFHKEVTFLQGLPQKIASEATFWVVRKWDGHSSIKHYEENPVKNTYEILWDEIRKAQQEPNAEISASIQNTMRRILEYYYKYYGNLPLGKIHEKVNPQYRVIVRSLISWINDGSHSAFDDLYYTAVSNEEYLKAFRIIFEELGHIAHYKMMMGIETME